MIRTYAMNPVVSINLHIGIYYYLFTVDCDPCSQDENCCTGM